MLLLPVDRNGAKSKGELSVVICAKLCMIQLLLWNSRVMMAMDVVNTPNAGISPFSGHNKQIRRMGIH